jgi:large subunit ribosomal protein L4e
MKTKVYGTDGSDKGHIELPSVFETIYNPTVIKRTVLAMQTAQKQPKGTDLKAGMKNTARYVGTRDAPTSQRTINVEHARLPRLKNKRDLLFGNVAQVPQSVGGRRAHPPKVQTVTIERVNRKERRLALDSAIAATASKALVEKRFIVEKELPIVIEDKFESTARTKEVVATLNKIGVGKDIENAKAKIRRRAGKGKTRGRTKKQKKSVLIVSLKNSPLLKASRNLPGVDAVTINSLNVELLAPGAEAGRLVVWTKGAIEEMGKEKRFEAKAEVKNEKKVIGKIKKETRKKGKIKNKKKASKKKKGAKE